MKKYRVRVVVEEVRGRCALGYRPGDSFVVEKYYVPPMQDKPICIHAFAAMLTILSPFLKGVSAKDMGVGPRDDTAYVQCPDPGPRYTCGGTVVFRLRREELGE